MSERCSCCGIVKTANGGKSRFICRFCDEDCPMYRPASSPVAREGERSDG